MGVMEPSITGKTKAYLYEMKIKKTINPWNSVFYSVLLRKGKVQLIKLSSWSSELNEKYMIFHMFTCIFTIYITNSQGSSTFPPGSHVKLVG